MMNLSRSIRTLCVAGLLSIVGVAGAAMAVPAGAASAGGQSSGGSWPGHGSWHFPGHPGRPPATCSGTLTAPGILSGTYQSSVVVSGLCLVNGGPTTIWGNLTIAPNAGLNATFALNDVAGTGTSSLTVHGNIYVQSGALLGIGCEPTFSPCSDDPDAGNGGTLTGSNTVLGSIIETAPLGVIAHATTISGNVVELGGGGGVNCNVPTTGVFSLLQSPVFSDYEDNTIGGSLAIGGLQTCWLGALRNDVKGSVLDIKNTFADPDANEVVSNTIHQNMVCFGNSPAVQFGDSTFESPSTPNQVGGFAFGECSFSTEQPNPAPNEPPTGQPPYYPGGPLTPISVKM